MVLDALPAGLPWLFGLLLWRHRASPGRSPQLGVARSAIRQHPAVRHGPERKGRPVSRSAGSPRACGRLSLGPSPEPCGQGVHRARWQATIPKERGPLDCRGDCESGIAGGRHRNRRQGPCLPQPASQLRPPLATVRPERQRCFRVAGPQQSDRNPQHLPGTGAGYLGGHIRGSITANMRTKRSLSSQSVGGLRNGSYTNHNARGAPLWEASMGTGVERSGQLSPND